MATMQQTYDSIPLNADQAAFMDVLLRAARAVIRKSTCKVHTLHGVMRGGEYSDYVVTLRMSSDGRTVEAIRNRDGSLVFGMYDGKISSVGWEYIFIQQHLEKLLSGK